MQQLAPRLFMNLCTERQKDIDNLTIYMKLMRGYYMSSYARWLES
jgi:hypothetical protein